MSHRSACALWGKLVWCCFPGSDGGSFWEVSRVSKEGKPGLQIVIKQGLLCFSCRWHLATHKMKAAGEFPYTAGLPARLCSSPCFHSEKRLLSFEGNFLQIVVNQCYVLTVLFTLSQGELCKRALHLQSG